MRIRATVVAVSGVLALSALAAPAAQADGGLGNTKITKVVVDGDNAVTVAASSTKNVKVSVTATDNSGIAGADAFSLVGPGYGYLSTAKPTCVKVNATTSTCSASVLVDPRVGDLLNTNAGTWYVDAWIDAKDGDFVWKQKAGSFKVQRASQLSANATPEPVKKGKTITVTGKLSRANWETNKNAGYAGQPVKLQFRKKSSSTYTTVKTVKTNSSGNLSTTVKATVDGYFRYSFAGTSTTPAISAAGDFIDVK
ncbi:calcium-binding protein [Streptomyces graminifolii]|uniref:calcium-binding protein n=1 Tax=Streptomyces graminifolii TaxID=1266771 RepID=UPI004058DD3A